MMYRGGERSPADLLARARREPDDEARWELVTELHADASREAFELAVSLCDSSETTDRCLAAQVLGQLGTPLMPWRERSSAPLRALLADPDDDVVRAAAVALGHLRVTDAIDDLVALRVHGSAEVRHAVAFALMSHDDPRTVATLVELTRDESALVRDWATFALATQLDTDTPDVRGALALRLEDRDEGTRFEALVGLAKRRDSRAVGPLLRCLAGANPPPALVDASRAMASRDLLPALLSLAEHGWGTSGSETALLDEAILACREGVRGLP